MQNLEKIYFNSDYFGDYKGIKRIEIQKVPLGVPGAFDVKVIIRYKSWYKLREMFVFSSEKEAMELFNFIKDEMSTGTVSSFLEEIKKQSDFDDFSV